MKNSTKALLWVLLVFSIGTAFGAAVVKLSQRSRLVADDATMLGFSDSDQPGPRQESAREDSWSLGRDQPMGLSGGVLEGMLRRLDMSDEQKARFREILERSRTDYTGIEESRNLQQRELRQRALRDLREILNPRQRRQLGVFLRQLQVRRRIQGR